MLYTLYVVLMYFRLELGELGCSQSAIGCIVSMQGLITVPVVVWLFVVQPISLRTMHDEEQASGRVTLLPVFCHMLQSKL